MKLLIILMTLFSVNSFAKCCICQTDNSIESEIKFYKLGCKLWLTGKFCSYEKVVDVDDDLSSVLPAKCDGQVAQIGFVGHWSSAWESKRFIENRIVPLVKERNMSVEVVNTACSATDDSESLQEFVNELDIPEDKYINFRGNQAISLGLWKGLTTWKENFYSEVDTRLTKPKYPKCSEYEGKTCMGLVQEYETGRCEDDKTNELRELTCCYSEYEETRVSHGPRKAARMKKRRTIKVKGFAWSSSNSCLYDEFYQKKTRSQIIEYLL